MTNGRGQGARVRGRTSAARRRTCAGRTDAARRLQSATALLALTGILTCLGPSLGSHGDLHAQRPQSDARIPVSLPADARVQVEVRGLTEELEDNVLATMSLTRTPSSTRLTAEELLSLVERAPREVQLALEPFGYYEPTVRDSVRYDGRRWRVLFDVAPGPPVVLTTADVLVDGPGATDTAFVNVQARFALAPGSPLSQGAYEDLKGALARTAADRGYLDAAFDSSVIFVDRPGRRASVVLTMKTGPRYRLGDVRFEQDILNEDFFRAVVPWDRGDPYQASELRRLQANLGIGSYFQSIEVVPQRDQAEDLVVPVQVTLTPTRPRSYSAGVGYGTDTGARVTFTAELRRLNRMGHRATVDAWVAQVESRATGSYVIPLGDRFGSLLTFQGGWVSADPVTSEAETWLVGGTIEGIRGDWRAQLGANLERANFEVGQDKGTSTLLLLGVGMSRIRADDRIAPERGTLLRGRLLGSAREVLSDVSLLDGGVEARWVHGFLGRMRFLWRGEVAALITSDFRRLPPALRYFTGGDRTVRGYEYEALGPRDELGNVIGGSKLAVTSAEFDFRVRTNWRIAAFVDVGNALDSWMDPLKAGAGMGLRWRSPIGMVRVDLASALSEAGRPFRWHLNLGPEL